MGNNLIERRSVDLTPDLAEHYLTFNTYEAQRTVRPLHIQELVDKMRNGDFRYGNVALASLNGDKQILIDGQHVCYATIEFGKGVPIMLEQFRCKNKNSMAKLFRQFNMLVRSSNDCAKAKHIAMGFEWSSEITKLAISALGIDYKLKARKSASSDKGRSQDGHLKASVTTGVVYETLSFTLDQKIDLIDSHSDALMFLAGLLRNDDGTYRAFKSLKHVRRALIVMMIFRTYWVSEPDAKIFWMDVFYGQGLLDNQPSYHLREFLINIRSSSKHGYKENVTDHEYMARITRAWNNFRGKGGSPKSIYLKDKPIPELR